MTDLMKGKRGLVMGVANERSIAWGIARALHAEGAELAFSYQGEAFGKRVEPLAASVGSTLMVDVDVMDDASMDACFAKIAETWGSLDFPRPRHSLFRQDGTDGPLHQHPAVRTSRNSLTISCLFLHRRVAPGLGTDARRRHASDDDLPRVEPRDALLQRHGRGQGCAGILGAVSRQRSRPAGPSASTRSARGR